MNFKTLLLMLIGCAISSNYTLVRFFNAEALIYNSRRALRRNVKFTAYLCLVLIISILIMWPVELCFISRGSGFLRVLIYESIILIVVNVLGALFKKDADDIYNTALSSGVLGTALVFEEQKMTFLQTIFGAVGVSLGFLLVTIALAAVNEKVRDRNVAPHFKGFPIMLVSIAIISMTVYAF